jgi:hypothetical protein
VRRSVGKLVAGSGGDKGDIGAAAAARVGGGGDGVGGGASWESGPAESSTGRGGWTKIAVPAGERVVSVAASAHHAFGLVFTESGKTFTVGDVSADGTHAVAGGSKDVGRSSEAIDDETELHHPSHKHAVKLNSRPSGWHCDVCGKSAGDLSVLFPNGIFGSRVCFIGVTF